MEKIQAVFDSLPIKLMEVLSTFGGWLLTILLAIINFLGGYKMALIAVLVCIILDAIWGITAAIKRGSYARSELMRDTLSKAGAYGSGLLMFMLIEALIGVGWTYGTDTLAAVICITELWSMSANILIVNPRVPFFRMLNKALTGEIARKLGISEDEVKVTFDEMAKEDKKAEKKRKEALKKKKESEQKKEDEASK